MQGPTQLDGNVGFIFLILFGPKWTQTSWRRIQISKAPFSLKLHQSTQLTEFCRSLHFQLSSPPTQKKSATSKFSKVNFFCCFLCFLLARRSPKVAKKFAKKCGRRAPYDSKDGGTLLQRLSCIVVHADIAGNLMVRSMLFATCPFASCCAT